MRLSRGSKSTVSLDIGANAVKMVKLNHTKNGYSVGSLAMRELPPEAIVADEIRDREAVIFSIQSLMDECDPGIKDVVVSLSGHALITDKLIIDRKTGAEAEQAILFEAEQNSARRSMSRMWRSATRSSGSTRKPTRWRFFSWPPERNFWRASWCWSTIAGSTR
jgi:hypothetical protein